MVVIGLIAGALTTGCWLPQLLRSWHTRSTTDLSWPYLAVFGIGIGLWMLYGVLKHDVTIVLTNCLTMALTLGVVGLKVWFEVLPVRWLARRVGPVVIRGNRGRG